MALEQLTANLNIIQELVIELLEDDLDVIQKLDDEPNDVGGLTAAELKAKFDQAGNIIKDYINNTLLPAISDTVAEASVRAAAEQERVENENTRNANEAQRQVNETARQSAETARVTAESARVSAENARAAAEAARQNQEGTRQSQEAERVQAEQARADENAGIVAQATAQKDAAAGSALLSQSWAVGGTGTRAGEDNNNARYWAGQAAGAASGVKMASATIPRGRMIGDVNNDGVINSEDATLIGQHYAGLIQLTGEDYTAADINNDNAVNASDRTLLLTRINTGKAMSGAYQELTGNWTVNPNYATENAQFYCDLPVAGMTASSRATLLLTSEYGARFLSAECISGAVRVWVSSVPPTASDAAVVWLEDGDGSVTIIAGSPNLSEQILAEASAQIEAVNTSYRIVLTASDWELIGDVYYWEYYNDVLKGNKLKQRVDLVPFNTTQETRIETYGVKYSAISGCVEFTATTLPTENIVYVMYITNYTQMTD